MAVGEEERVGADVVKLVAIVALNSLDGHPKLHPNLSPKLGDSQKSARLELKRKRPQIM
jgi:hypothetical protein